MMSRLYTGKAAYAVGFGLVVLVIALAVLQHTWLGELSERETERMMSNLRHSAFQFSMELSREFTRLEVFRNDAGAVPEGTLGAALQQQLHRWNAMASYPRIVEGIYVVNDSQSSAWILRDEHLMPISYPPGDWTPLSEEPASWVRVGPGQLIGVLVRHDLRLCVVPSGPRYDGGRTGNHIVVTLDREYLVDSLCARLLDVYLGRNMSGELDVLLVAEDEGNREIIYASSENAKLISADRADVVIPFVGGGGPPGSPGPGFRDHPVPGAEPGMRRDGEMTDRPFPKRSMLELRIQHRAGSLESVVRQNRMINLAIGSGILVLLLAGVAFILMTSRHAASLGRQQIEFVAGISHELRTPLAVLQSVGDNLADGVVTDIPKARSYGKMVRTEVQRLTTMVENALAFAGITSGKWASDFHPVDLRQVVRKACQSSQFLLEEQGVDLELELPDSFPMILGDAVSLRSVVENLISNAMKYSDDHPWIGISLGTGGGNGQVTLTVRDRGIGIARRELPHLFDPFYRGREAIKRQIRGSGLGLNLAYHIIKRHGGTITVESTVGEGSTFFVHLPAQRPTEA
jgi:signal transduction histidine kinase